MSRNFEKKLPPAGLSDGYVAPGRARWLYCAPGRARWLEKVGKIKSGQPSLNPTDVGPTGVFPTSDVAPFSL